MTKDARAIAEETARASYGRLVAWLSSRTRDVAAVEDALGDAFRAALETWPETGAPASPEAWLLTAARRKLIDGARRAKVRSAAEPSLAIVAEEAGAAAADDFPDERLKLLFICAHPAIDPTVRTPLMLQTVLGLDAARIAAAFAVTPTAMSGRLVRAKRKIKAAGIPFEPPQGAALHDRLTAVHDAIYAAFGAGWNDLTAAAGATNELSVEAMYLARLLTHLAPDAAESWGLLALMLYAEARSAARRSGDVYVPFSEQDVDRWDRDMIAAAEQALQRAWSLQSPGRFQLEAAIQSAHAAARLHARDTDSDIVILYRRLMDIAPSLGAAAGYAAALDRTGRSAEALSVLNAVNADKAAHYQPFWAVRAHVLNRLNRAAEAEAAFEKAIELAADPPTIRFLYERRRAAQQAAAQNQ